MPFFVQASGVSGYFFWIDPLVAHFLGGVWSVFLFLFLAGVRRYLWRPFLLGVIAVLAVQCVLLQYVPGGFFLTHSPVWLILALDFWAILLCRFGLPIYLAGRVDQPVLRQRITRRVILTLLLGGTVIAAIGFPGWIYLVSPPWSQTTDLLMTVALGLSPLWVALALGGFMAMPPGFRLEQAGFAVEQPEQEMRQIAKTFFRWGLAFAGIGTLVSILLLWLGLSDYFCSHL